MKKVIYSIYMFVVIATMASCQKTETNIENSAGNKILGTWKIVSVKGGPSNPDYSLQKGDMLCFFNDCDEDLSDLICYFPNRYEWRSGSYDFSDNRLLLFLDTYYTYIYYYDLEIVKLTDAKMVLSGVYLEREGGVDHPIDIELERVNK